jgi:hypothetical protein
MQMNVMQTIQSTKRVGLVNYHQLHGSSMMAEALQEKGECISKTQKCAAAAGLAAGN